MGGGRPISLSLNTGSGAPYFAIAQYGLRRALLPAAIRAFATAISPVGLNTPPRSPGGALCLPRAVFWRPFRALVVGTIGNPTPLVGEYVEFDGE